MMILSAAYANPEHTAAVVRTADRGDVCLSAHDNPSEWAALLGAVQPAAFSVDLAELKRELISQVQRQFDELCGEIVTPGGIMANVYRVQVDAAYRLKAGMITTHPALSSLVGVDGLGATEAAVANTIASKNEQCESAISTLNAKRLGAKSAIMNALDEARARAAAVVNWDA